MTIVEQLRAEIERGFSKSDLERLIGLPKNNLSEVLKGKRKLSKKSELKTELWLKSEKPNPLFCITAPRKQKYDGCTIEKICDSVNKALKPLESKKKQSKATASAGVKKAAVEAENKPQGDKPRNLDELKKLMPEGLDTFERSEWVRTERQKYGI